MCTYMHATALADAGLHEGGFCYNIARKAHVKNLKPRPLLIKNTPIFDRFGEKFLALPVNLSIFDRDFC